jgi:hypothetical protein
MDVSSEMAVPDQWSGDNVQVSCRVEYFNVCRAKFGRRRRQSKQQLQLAKLKLPLAKFEWRAVHGE